MQKEESKKVGCKYELTLGNAKPLAMKLYHVEKTSKPTKYMVKEHAKSSEYCLVNIEVQIMWRDWCSCSTSTRVTCPCTCATLQRLNLDIDERGKPTIGYMIFPQERPMAEEMIGLGNVHVGPARGGGLG